MALSAFSLLTVIRTRPPRPKERHSLPWARGPWAQVWRFITRTAAPSLCEEAFDHVYSCCCPKRKTRQLLAEQDWPWELFEGGPGKGTQLGERLAQFCIQVGISGLEGRASVSCYSKCGLRIRSSRSLRYLLETLHLKPPPETRAKEQICSYFPRVW